MHLRLTALSLVLTVSAFAACRTPDAAAPRASLGSGSRGTDDVTTSHAALVACGKRTTLTDSGEFGPNGGTLWVGHNRLIIPPGALTKRVVISGTLVGDTVAFIKFEPSGLQFRRPAGLVLDASDCSMATGSVPSIVYLNEHGDIVEQIEAVYNNAWHTVAAPIQHFSGYAIAF